MDEDSLRGRGGCESVSACPPPPTKPIAANKHLEPPYAIALIKGADYVAPSPLFDYNNEQVI